MSHIFGEEHLVLVLTKRAFKSPDMDIGSVQLLHVLSLSLPNIYTLCSRFSVRRPLLYFNQVLIVAST